MKSSRHDYIGAPSYSEKDGMAMNIDGMMRLTAAKLRESDRIAKINAVVLLDCGCLEVTDADSTTYEITLTSLGRVLSNQTSVPADASTTQVPPEREAPATANRHINDTQDNGDDN